MEETAQTMMRSQTGAPAGPEQVQVYGGFWIRTLAAIIDTLLLCMLIVPLGMLVYGGDYWRADAGLAQGFWDFIFNYVLPAIAIILFWIYKSATPGKMVLKLRIIDAKTGGKPSNAQLIGRYFAYYVSIIPLLLGIFWVAFDPKKQGWHDKLAGTLVVRDVTESLHKMPEPPQA